MGILQMVLAASKGGSVVLFDYSVALVNTGGGEVSFQMSSDGSTSPDLNGWFSPLQSGIGSSYWVIISATSGTLNIISGTVGSRISLALNPQWVGEYIGSSARQKIFTMQVYDAATGGNLVGTGTLTLDVDGSA